MNKKQISDIQTGIWLIGLAILFITNDWWPGILILAGVSMVVSSVLRERAEPEPAPLPEAAEMDSDPLPDPSPAAVQDKPSVVVDLPPIPAANEENKIVRPVDRLPENCDACGAPVRGMDVHWTGFDSANCGFCGQALKMKPE